MKYWCVEHNMPAAVTLISCRCSSVIRHLTGTSSGRWWSGAEVAVKMFRNPTQAAVDDFQHEALVMAKVSHHPNVVHFIGASYPPDGMAMVLGLSRLLEDRQGEQTTNSSVGPVRWMAPEAIQQRKYSAASDAFSFGVLMAEVWSDGALPYADIHR